MFAEAAVHLASHNLRPIRSYSAVLHPSGVVTCTCGVHGCDKQGKHPVGTSWGSFLTTDPDQLFRSFGSEQFSVAIAVGQCIDIPIEEAVIDLESETDAGRVLIRELIGDVITPQWTSGIRPGETLPGLHSLFRPPTEFLSLPRADYPMPSVGIEYILGGRGKQRATTVPPSLHKTGVQRMWVPGRSLDDCAIAQLPYAAVIYLLDHVRAQNSVVSRPRNVRRSRVDPDSPEAHANVFGPVVASPDDNEEDEHENTTYRAQCQLRPRDSEVYQGDRNNQMHAFACSLWRRMCDVAGVNALFETDECDEMVMDLLIAKNLTACQPEPLPDSEINGIFNSSRRFMRGTLEREFSTGITTLPRVQYAVPPIIANARTNGHATPAAATVTVVAPVAPGAHPTAPFAPVHQPISVRDTPPVTATPQQEVSSVPVVQTTQPVVPITQQIVPQTQQIVPVAVTQATVAAEQTSASVVPIVPRNSAAQATAAADDNDDDAGSVPQQGDADAQPHAESFDAWKLQYGVTYVFDPTLAVGKNLRKRIDEWKIDATLQFIDGCDPKTVALQFRGMTEAVLVSESMLDKPVQLAREVFRLTRGTINLDPKSADWPWSALWLGGRIPGRKGTAAGFYSDLIRRSTVVHARDAVSLPYGTASEMSLSSSLRSGIDKLCGNITGIRNAHILEQESLQEANIAGVSSVNSKRLTVSNDGSLIEGQQGPAVTLTGVYVVDRELSILLDFDELLANRRQASQACPSTQVVACTLKNELGFARRRRRNSAQYGRWFVISVEAYLGGDGDDDDDDDMPDAPAPVSPHGVEIAVPCAECVA